MESIKREKRVLKLVHPGRHIEVHKKPIRASEIMRRNPRHCITRPDVFNFPWIVVKPDSILFPGSVFLIVPNHTIHELLKAKTTTLSRQESSQLEPTLSTKSQSPYSQQNQLLPPTNHVIQQDYSHDKSCDGVVVTSTPTQRHKQDTEHFLPLQDQSCVEIWPKVMSSSGYEEDSQKKMELVDTSTFEFRPYYKAVEYYEKYCDRDKKDVNLELVSGEQVTMLKSCLKRPGRMCKKLNLKVSFNLPMEKEEH